MARRDTAIGARLLQGAHLDTNTGTQPSGCRVVSIAPCCSVNAAFLFAEPRLVAVVSRCALFARHLDLGFGVLRFGTSLELGVWCLVFRSAVAQKLRCGAPQAVAKTEFSKTRSRVLVAALQFPVAPVFPPRFKSTVGG